MRWLNVSYDGATLEVADMTKLWALLQDCRINQVFYLCDGFVISDMVVKAMLAESYHIRKDGNPRYRMVVCVTDDLWLWIAKSLMTRDEELKRLRKLSESTLLSYREVSQELSEKMFIRYEVGTKGVLRRSNDYKSFLNLVELATIDTYPSRHGQPLFLLDRYSFNDRYLASVKGSQLQIELPKSVVSSVRQALYDAVGKYI